MSHLKEIGKGYFSHLFGAWKMAVIFLIGAVRCVFHGLIPNMDTKCAQNTANKVNHEIPESLS
mgnify:FL=1|jgi:hypothetical protein